jgi:hypothetical protein
MQLGSDSAPAVVITPGAGVAQMGAPLEMPADGRVFAIGTYIRSLAGFGGLDYRLVLWGWGGAVDSPNRILGQTALHTVGAAARRPTCCAWPGRWNRRWS